MTRGELLATLADRLVALDLGHPVRVAVDGITAAGKTTFARELVGALSARGRRAVHVSADGFHHLRAHRRRRADDPARGYYEDAYDFDALVRRLLLPLGPGGDRRYLAAVHDLASDAVLRAPVLTCPHDAVVVVDGSFLQRPDLAAHWDVAVWIETSFPVALARAVPRDAAMFGSEEAARAAYTSRYHPACRLYLAEVDAAGRADFVVENDDIENPVLRELPR